jgi:hypothetical protein
VGSVSEVTRDLAQTELLSLMSHGETHSSLSPKYPRRFSACHISE